MSTHAHSSDANHDPLAPLGSGQIHAAPVHHAPPPSIPIWLIAAFGVVLVAGAALIFGRGKLDENASFEAMRNCEAKVNAELRERGDDGQYINVRPNGLADGYALVRIYKERDSIAAVFSLCDRADPESGLRLYRKAFTADGNKSAKLVALQSTTYLAHSQTTPQPQTEKGVLEAEDIQLIINELDAGKEKELDVRKAALHALSDLVVITNQAAVDAVTKDPKAETRYSKISDTMTTAAQAGLDADAGKDQAEKETRDRRRDLKISVRSDTVNGKPVLLIRWSTPPLALAWWKENLKDGAAWNKDMQRFVFP